MRIEFKACFSYSVWKTKKKQRQANFSLEVANYAFFFVKQKRSDIFQLEYTFYAGAITV